jgi:hypothetical protein
MIRRSDTLEPVTSSRDNPAILRRVALVALADARYAWKKARGKPDAKRTRAAYCACVFAARALRRAAAVIPREASRLLEQAEAIDEAAANLGAELVSLEVVAEVTAAAKP